MSSNRIDCLDRGYVELQMVAGTDQTIVNAARTSFVGDSKGEEADRKLLRYLYTHKHTSPFEMVEFWFRIKAPLIVWWQEVRHRTQSLNLQSARYTELSETEVYIPHEWRLQSKSNKQGSEGILDEDNSMILHTELIKMYELGFQAYQWALRIGVAKEQARLFLPGFSVYYTGIVKMNAHNLMHFMRLRTAPDAQLEIRVYAGAMLQFFTEALPWTAALFNEEI